uniref:Uncharacterized protein n=1 Tax=Gouania willdenowi TaxID=441366 RepID=A0A8C5DV71_GOUWI
MLKRSQLSTGGDDQFLSGGAFLCAQRSHLLHHLHAVLNVAKGHVFEVQVLGFLQGDEELRVVGVSPAVGHGQNAWPRVAYVKVLIFKLSAVDGLSPSAVAVVDMFSTCSFAHLTHEIRYDSVEDGALQSEAFLPRAERSKVLRRLRGDVGEELDDNGSQWLFVCAHFEEHLWVGVSRVLLDSGDLRCTHT